MALRSVSAVTFTSPERGGQADVPDEGSQGIDAPEGKGVIVHVPALNAPDADSEADEFRETVLINAPVIGRMEHCEAGAVIAVHVRAYLMLHHVTHEVRLLAELYYAVLGHGGVPHEVASGRVILFVTEGRPQIADDAAHERLADVVGHVVRARRAEVDFHQVGERVKHDNAFARRAAGYQAARGGRGSARRMSLCHRLAACPGRQKIIPEPPPARPRRQNTGRQVRDTAVP